MKSLSIIQKGILLTILMSAFCFTSSNKILAQDGQVQINFEKIRKEALKDALIPIRPGIPGLRSFWNTYAKRFIYVPSFDFKLVDGAKKYKFTATASDSLKYSFVADKPWNNLAPIWEKMPVGFVSLQVQGLDVNNKPLGLAGSRKFYKAAPFQGPYQKKVMDYRESAKAASQYIYNLSYIQKWKYNSVPDTTYKLYCYPSKIIGAVVENMLLYRNLFPQNASDALVIAKNAANYLISISEPKGAPLEYFPPTYKGEAKAAKKYKGQFMITYPAEAAFSYLDLFDITGDQSYMDAAIRIAGTYKKLQIPSGTWKLKYGQNGEAITEIDCIPIILVEFFDRLHNQYKIDGYQTTRDNAFNWIMNNPVQTFNWTGQFEDVPPSEPYKNLNKYEACYLAIYLFERVNEKIDYKDIAEELLHYSEDQFVVWEQPMPQKKSKVQEWITPCALEQYSYYVPIGGSASLLIETFLKAYQVTGEKSYWAKAIELENTMTVAQDPETGRYPTNWEWNERRTQLDWINGTCRDIKAMLKMADNY